MRRLPERLRARLLHAVGADATASRVAAAWALGVAIGLSPLLGLHTAIALLLAFAFRLSKVDVLLGTLVINPWTLPPYFASSVVLGMHLTGIAVPRIDLPDLQNLIDPSYWRVQGAWLTPLLEVWTVGSLVFALAGGIVTFAVTRALVERHRAHRRLAERR